MKLYIGSQMVLPVLGRLVLRKRRSEAAATLQAVLYTAPSDTYFQQLSLAAGDAVRLLDDDGSEVFLGSIHILRRTPEQVEFTAYDKGVFLAKNELYGLFSGTTADIASQVAKALEIPLGTVEETAGRYTIVSRAGQSAYSILRQAAGKRAEIFIQGDALCIQRQPYMVYPLEPSQVLSVSGEVSLEPMVNRCVVVNWRGNPASSAETAPDITAYGRMQTVLGKSGSDAAAQARAALCGKAVTGEISVLGNLAFRCGCAVELHRAEWGLDGVYAVIAAEHRWERGLYTTHMELELIR